MGRRVTNTRDVKGYIAIDKVRNQDNSPSESEGRDRRGSSDDALEAAVEEAKAALRAEASSGSLRTIRLAEQPQPSLVDFFLDDAAYEKTDLTNVVLPSPPKDSYRGKAPKIEKIPNWNNMADSRLQDRFMSERVPLKDLEERAARKERGPRTNENSAKDSYLEVIKDSNDLVKHFQKSQEQKDARKLQRQKRKDKKSKEMKKLTSLHLNQKEEIALNMAKTRHEEARRLVMEKKKKTKEAQRQEEEALSNYASAKRDFEKVKKSIKNMRRSNVGGDTQVKAAELINRYREIAERNRRGATNTTSTTNLIKDLLEIPEPEVDENGLGSLDVDYVASEATLNIDSDEAAKYMKILQKKLRKYHSSNSRKEESDEEQPRSASESSSASNF